MEKKVSIIVPVYQVEKYLSKCLDSIINQSYANLEILLVDDGSKDGSGKICDDYALKDKRIKAVHQKNAGLSGARNTGIYLSTGEYLMFIDSDDYIEADMVSYLMEKSEQYNADITICDYCNVVNDNIEYNQYPDKEFVVKGTEKYDYLYNQYALPTIIAVNKLYRREVFENIYYPLGKTHEDEYVIADVLKNADRICYSLKPLYYYVRERADSIMNSYSTKKFDFIDAYQHRYEFFEQNNNSKLRDLTEYSTIMLLIARLNEYIDYCQNPDRVFVMEKLQDVEKRIEKLRKKNNLSLKRNLKLTLYKLRPSMYNKKIQQYLGTANE